MPGHLTHLAGQKVHPLCWIEVDLLFDASRVQGSFSLSTGLTGKFHYRDQTHDLNSGTQSIML